MTLEVSLALTVVIMKRHLDLIGPKIVNSLKDMLSGVFARVDAWFTSADPTSVLAAVVVTALAVLFRRSIARLVISALSWFLNQFSVKLSDDARNELTVTTSILIVTLVVSIALEALNFPVSVNKVGRRILTSIAVMAVFAGWYNLCGPFVSMLSGDRRMQGKLETGWMERVARFAVVLFGLTALLTVWEVDISGALTGVGVLGAGLAIATQDLIRNLMAGMNNMSEKRFSVGDTVQIEGVLIGTVEQIDLRSTLVRGFDQIPRFVPNSDLSNAVVLNYSKRKKRRVLQSFGFVLSLTPEQIDSVCASLKDHLLTSGDFDTSEDAPKHVYVDGLTPSSVSIMFYAWTKNADYEAYLEVIHRLSQKVLAVSKETDAPLAYPTQTIRVENPEDSIQLT